MGRWMKIVPKRAVIRKAHASPELSQEDLAAWVRTTYKLRNAPARNIVSNILKNAAAILSDKYGDDNRKKPLRVASPTLENRLASWIEGIEQRNICLSRQLMQV
ncbi:unnamed protein product [Phytophthora fragariaefolia]|uniref:Unnamed protein product n=1 Tax=Phytophthora fragariaefolia TaxID=1490495 RepID=A0A9W7D7P4_9STRA|nr:unnamed protein product [Phytophthora fragariaefolia]